MKKIAAFAFIGTLLQLVCVFLYLIIDLSGISYSIFPFISITIQVLQLIGIGMVCFFFYAIWKGQK